MVTPETVALNGLVFKLMGIGIGLTVAVISIRTAVSISGRAHSPMCVLEYDIYRAASITGMLMALMSYTNIASPELLANTPAEGMALSWACGLLFFVWKRWQEIHHGQHPLLCNARKLLSKHERVLRNPNCPYATNCDAYDTCPFALSDDPLPNHH